MKRRMKPLNSLKSRAPPHLQEAGFDPARECCRGIAGGAEGIPARLGADRPGFSQNEPHDGTGTSLCSRCTDYRDGVCQGSQNARHGKLYPQTAQKEGEPEAVLISTSQTRQSAAQFLPWLQSKLSEGQTWFVCDSETEEDLQAIAGLFSQLDKKILWAGSAGLIEYLPEACP